MNRAERAFDNLQKTIFRNGRFIDPDLLDVIEVELNELESAIGDLMLEATGYISPQVEVELENILDVCACWDRHTEDDNYGKVLGSVHKLREELYGD